MAGRLALPRPRRQLTAAPEARAAMDAALDAGFGNPSGAHALARAGAGGARRCRAPSSRSSSGPTPGEVVFTSGGTEADNLAVRGVLAARGGTAVCTAIEHKAVLEPVRASGGRIVPVDRRGRRRPRRPRRPARRRRHPRVGRARQQRGRHRAAARRGGGRRPARCARRRAPHRRRPGAHLARPARRGRVGRPRDAGVAQVRRAGGGRCAGRAHRGAARGPADRRRAGAGAPQRHAGRRRARPSFAAAARAADDAARRARRASNRVARRPRRHGAGRGRGCARERGARRIDRASTSWPGSPTCAFPPSTAKRSCSCSSTTTACWPAPPRAARAAPRSPRTCWPPSASIERWRRFAAAVPGLVHHPGRHRRRPRGGAGGGGPAAARTRETEHRHERAGAGRDVGRRRLVGRGRAAAGGGSRRRGRHPQAVGWRVRLGLLLGRGCRRRALGGPSPRHRAPHVQLRRRLRRARGGALRGRSRRRSHAQPVHRVQPAPQVRPAAAPRRRARLRRRSPPATTLGSSSTADGSRRVARGADASQGPVVRRAHARPGRPSRASGSRSVTSPRPTCGRTPPASGLATADKPDSQDVCFITATGGRTAFLEPRLETHPGTVVDRAGEPVGQVRAVELVTIGQRHGLGLPGGTEPRYVVDIDVPSAVVTVGARADLLVDHVELEHLDWVGRPRRRPAPRPDERPRLTPCVHRRRRHRASSTSPPRRVAPGQSVVLYAGDEVVAGGITR